MILLAMLDSTLAGAIETWPSELPWRWNRIQKPQRQPRKKLAAGTSVLVRMPMTHTAAFYHLWCKTKLSGAKIGNALVPYSTEALG
jgi:hypothetical protein